MKIVKTPKYWEDDLFQPLTEAKTAYGNTVMIPKRFTNGWETTKELKEWADKHGVDPLDGLEIDEENNPLYYDLERVFFEIYEEES